MDQIHEDNQRQRRKQQDHDDYHAELAGVETGRQKRFLPHKQTEHDKAAKSREERQALTRLQLLLQDPLYRRHYEAFSQFLDETDAKITDALIKLENQKTHLQAQLERMRDHAHRTEDGTLFLVSEQNGKAYTLDGRALNDEELESALWNDKAVSLEAYRSVEQQLATNQNASTTLIEAQSDIDDTREDLQNGEYSIDQMQAMQSAIGDKVDSALANVASDEKEATPLETDNAYQAAIAPSATTDIPKL